MPTIIVTKKQLLRLLGNTSLQEELFLVRTNSHQNMNTPEEHLLSFYQTFSQVRDQRFDALIIKATPVEHLPYEKEDYRQELKEIIDWGFKNVFSLLYFCWGSQVAFYHQVGIPKHSLPAKHFGVSRLSVVEKNIKMLRGFDDVFYGPHLRRIEISRAENKEIPELIGLAELDEAGVSVAATIDFRQVDVTSFSEYNPLTYKIAFDREFVAGLLISIPVNYSPNDVPARMPEILRCWRAHLLFANRINYYVFEETLNDLDHFNGFSRQG